MIQIRLWRSQDNAPERLSITGHAGGRYGHDIVCAAASALVETLMLGLQEVVVETPEGFVNPGAADLRFFRPMSGEARAIIETIVRGLKDLAESEPKAVAFSEEISSH